MKTLLCLAAFLALGALPAAAHAERLSKVERVAMTQELTAIGQKNVIYTSFARMGGKPKIKVRFEKTQFDQPIAVVGIVTANPGRWENGQRGTLRQRVAEARFSIIASGGQLKPFAMSKDFSPTYRGVDKVAKAK